MVLAPRRCRGDPRHRRGLADRNEVHRRDRWDSGGIPISPNTPLKKTVVRRSGFFGIWIKRDNFLTDQGSIKCTFHVSSTGRLVGQTVALLTLPSWRKLLCLDNLTALAKIFMANHSMPHLLSLFLLMIRLTKKTIRSLWVKGAELDGLNYWKLCYIHWRDHEEWRGLIIFYLMELVSQLSDAGQMLPPQRDLFCLPCLKKWGLFSLPNYNHSVPAPCLCPSLSLPLPGLSCLFHPYCLSLSMGIWMSFSTCWHIEAAQ